MNEILKWGEGGSEESHDDVAEKVYVRNGKKERGKWARSVQVD
jgi:hypothetical protein